MKTFFIVLIFLSVFIIGLMLIRVIKGPSIFDRLNGIFVIGLDIIFVLLLGLCSFACAEGESTLIYGSGDYTRINPAMDEHGEINLLIFDGLTAHDAQNNVVDMATEIRYRRVGGWQ